MGDAMWRWEPKNGVVVGYGPRPLTGYAIEIYPGTIRIWHRGRKEWARHPRPPDMTEEAAKRYAEVQYELEK